jgi:hypothetical protein
MKFDKNLAAVHAYLCADGYVTKNPLERKKKYYRIGLRNTNQVLLKDFQKRFYNYFRVMPPIRKDGRCEKCSKEINELLLREFGSFYSWEWRMPKLNKKLVRVWLRAYFDCEGWVFCKRHQNRHIGVDCVNEKGLNQVIKALNQLGIKTIKKFNKKRKIFRIFIYGKENIKKFRDNIGFLHPDKAEVLNDVIKDYMVYEWTFPTKEKECKKFIKKILEEKARIKKPFYIRLISREKRNLKKLRYLLKKFYNIDSLLYNCVNGIGTKYYEIDINQKEEVKKIKGLVPKVFKSINI